MATIHFRGDATATAQVTRVTPANVEVGDTFTLTVNNKSISFIATAATVANVTAGLSAAWNNATAAELAEVTATDDTTHLTLTADTAGVPFTVTASAADGDGSDTQSLTISSITASAGPLHWDTPANWSSGAVPTSGDDVYIAHSDKSIRYGLDQSAVTLDSLQIAASFTGEIGLPRLNSSGASEYVEYRARYLAVSCTELTIGSGSGEGSGRLQLDTGSNRTTIVIHSTGTPAEQDAPVVLWLGTHASNAMHVHGGSVGVALAGGESATLTTFSQTGGQVTLGAGVLLSNLTLSEGGRLSMASTPDTLTQSGGRAEIRGAAAAGTLNISGGVLEYRATGTINALNVTGDAALVDFSRDGQSRSVAACTLTGGEIYDPLRTVSYGSGIEPGGRITGYEAA